MKSTQRKQLEKDIEDIIFDNPATETIEKLADFVEKKIAEQSNSYE